MDDFFLSRASVPSNTCSRSVGALPKTCQKIWGRPWNFFLLKALESVLHQWWKLSLTECLHWNFYANIQLIRGRFWLQLWTVKKFSEPRVSCKYRAKMWKNSKMPPPFAATVRRCADGRSCLFRRKLHRVVYNASAASAVTRGAGHMLSEKSQQTQNGAMFVDLNWPLNASRRLSASAELLVHSTIER